MVLSTIVLAASLATQPAAKPHVSTTASVIVPGVTVIAPIVKTQHQASIQLHSMTEEEKRTFPGRERFDKTEWYESCFKSARSVIAPEHVDEWKNGGVDAA